MLVYSRDAWLLRIDQGGRVEHGPGDSLSSVDISETVFERSIRLAHDWPTWFQALLFGVSLATPFLLAFFEGDLPEVLRGGNWRWMALPPIIVAYTIVVMPYVYRSETVVADSLGSVAEADRETVTTVVAAARARSFRPALISFAIGALLGLWLSEPATIAARRSLLQWYVLFTYVIMFGMMGWIVYSNIASTRVVRALHRLTLRIDLFDLTPFEPVGRHALLLSVIFIGGTTISLIFIYRRENILRWQNVVIYSVLLSVTILIFFLAMWPAHGKLSSLKSSKIAAASRQIGRAYRDLEQAAAGEGNELEASASLRGWMAAEQRLKTARTWPYNTEMLRTLTLSVLTPIFIALSRLLVPLFLGGGS